MAASSAVSGGRSKRRRGLYALAATLCGLLPLLLLELGLRLGGFGEAAGYRDPLVGFSRLSSLFVLDDDGETYHTARSHLLLFERQEFAAEKPADAYRVFCLGGSTVRGRPYTVETAFPQWLQIELDARAGGRPIEVVNCGGLSYASYRLTYILEEVLAYEPDLIVIATGHNEFLEDRTYGDLKHRSGLRSWAEDRLQQLKTVRLLQELVRSEGAGSASDGRSVLPELVDPKLDQASGFASYHRDDAWAAAVHAHFDRSVRSMLALCRRGDVPVVLVLLGANLRDCPPFKSEHRPGITLDQEREWQTLFEEGRMLEESSPEAALEVWKRALAIDDEYALLRFQVARILDRLGRREEAAGHYLAAKDFDVCPLRMLEPFAATLEAIAAESGVPLVDARRRIETAAEGLPGNDWYMDHVHPTIGAHQLIAADLAALLADILSLGGWSEDDRRIARRRHLEHLEPNYLLKGYERVQWLENWSRRQRLLDETLPRHAASHVRYGHRLWDFADREQAVGHYRSALDEDAQLAASLLLRRCEDLSGQGRPGEAGELLDWLDKQEVASADEIAAAHRRISTAAGARSE